MAKQKHTKSDAKPLKVPKSIQQSIPINTIYRDGVFKVADRFSKTWGFQDINYSIASSGDQLSMFMAHCHTINAFPADTAFKITIFNRRLNPVTFSETTLLRSRPDNLQYLRDEMNGIISDSAAACNNIMQEKYITASVQKPDYPEAKNHFNRIGNELIANFGKLSSKVSDLSTNERLRLFHDFFRAGDEGNYRLNVKNAMRLGHDFKDYICPDGLQFKKDYFEMGGKFGRVIFMKDMPSFLHDTMIAELTEFPRSMMLSIDIQPIPTDEAVKEIQKRVLGIETDITRWQQKQNQNNNWATDPPYELSQMREEMKEFLDDLTKRDQRMMFGMVTVVHLADSLEKLKEDTDSLFSIGSKYMCQFGILNYQQEDALNTVLPYGLRRIEGLRTLTTESTAVLMPFSTQEIMHDNGLYLGTNAISKNLIRVDRAQLLNPHGFVLGVSGSGKSVTMKDIILSTALGSDDEIFIFDIEREYSPLVKAIGGTVIQLSPNSKHRVNIMEVNKDYAGDDNPILIKSELLMSVVEQQMGAGNLGAKDKSIIDRCVGKVYREYLKKFTGTPPVMLDVYNALLAQEEPEAKDIALTLELLTKGTLNIFSEQTNVNISSRITCFDLHELGQTLEAVGHTVMLDFLGNRVATNFARGVRTHIFLDEVHMFLLN